GPYGQRSANARGSIADTEGWLGGSLGRGSRPDGVRAGSPSGVSGTRGAERALAGGANHSRRKVAALGGGDPDGRTLSGWSDGFRALVGSLALIAPDRPAQTTRRRL